MPVRIIWGNGEALVSLSPISGRRIDRPSLVLEQRRSHRISSVSLVIALQHPDSQRMVRRLSGASDKVVKRVAGGLVGDYPLSTPLAEYPEEYASGIHCLVFWGFWETGPAPLPVEVVTLVSCHWRREKEHDKNRTICAWRLCPYVSAVYARVYTSLRDSINEQWR